MNTTTTKIGLIQTAPLPGDFSNNLRAIVQGYRECLEHGADIVIAPAAALCGLEPRSLASRRSFIAQTRAALDTLSRELGNAPLLLAAYTMMVNDDEIYVGLVGEDDEMDASMQEKDQSVILTPYLLEKDCVTELENCSTVTINGKTYFTETSDEELLPDEEFDFMVRLPNNPWYAGAARDDAETRKWEARMSGTTVICCRPVGTVGGNVYGGGSGVYSAEGQTLLRLPFFESAAKVVDIARTAAPVLNLPEAEELLTSALERGIRDNVRNNCFSGVCIPLDHPHSALLGVLCVEALGAANVCGITFEADASLADKLGINCFRPHTEELAAAAKAALGGEESAALTERLRSAIAITHAESRGMMYCSPLGRREIMLGEFHMYGLSAGHLAPLGNLYDVDIYLLSERFREEYSDVFGSITEPPHGVTNRIIHELADLNTPPSVLVREEMNYLFKENDVRLIQRKLMASAIKRTQLPIILHVDAPIEQLSFPLANRLND
ncbi:MAG: hypothetical protein E7032_01485 [Akkermansiaceae bacterium]|nr:hypothetical protein [Akkermansiaceae bacterium]